MTDTLLASVSTLSGVGAKRAKALAGLGVTSIADLLYFFPRRYEDRRSLTSLNGLSPDTFASIIAEVISVEERYSSKGSFLSAVLSDGKGFVQVVWFNALWVKQQVFPGIRLALYGKVQPQKVLTIVNPEFEVLEEEDIASNLGIVPIYPLISGITQKWLRKIIKNAIPVYSEALVDFIPKPIAEHLSLTPIAIALRELHYPQNKEKWIRARNRLAFDELFLLQTGLLIRKRERALSSGTGGALRSGEKFAAFMSSLPFPLTTAQKRVISEIISDLNSKEPMYRLLQGDVGSGKTIIAAVATIVAVDSGVQTAFMAPTEILAQQHYVRLKKIFSQLGIKVSLLTGSLSVSERRSVLADLADGTAQVVIGTHAIFSEGTQFLCLGFVVIDEQHRFGVRQKNALVEKGFLPHVLVMTATPIPRTLTLSVYGDLDVSILDELPPGRKPIKTMKIRLSEEPKLLKFINERIKDGHQVYWVCPFIEESETAEAAAVLSRFNRLCHILPGVRTGLLHSQMPAQDKESIMVNFAEGNIDLLVATVVIEVGVDVPNATVMVIEDAGRFGLAQLHQLRGRVGRGDTESICILLEGASTTPEGAERLETMIQTTDGFMIAEADLKQRGPGEVCGVRQHGITDFKVADLARDEKILKLAREEAEKFLEKDPTLITAPFLAKELQRRLGELLNIAGTA